MKWKFWKREKCSLCSSKEELVHVFNVDKPEVIVCRKCWKDSGFHIIMSEKKK